MKRFNNAFSVVLVSALFLGVSGCEDKPAAAPSGGNGAGNTPTGGGDDHHSHPSHGPHGGDLVELGNEDFHAELVHGDDDTITIYILDGAAKNAVPIDATEVLVNLSHDGKPEQFKLAASPDEGDPEGKSSRFVSDDAELAEHVHEEGVQAKLVAVIDGKQFTGKVAHDHDHGHAHE